MQHTKGIFLGYKVLRYKVGILLYVFFWDTVKVVKTKRIKKTRDRRDKRDRKDKRDRRDRRDRRNRRDKRDRRDTWCAIKKVSCAYPFYPFAGIFSCCWNKTRRET